MGWERKVCLFIATWIFLKMKKKARGWGYGFELYAGIKINVPQELSHRVAAVMYSLEKALIWQKRLLDLSTS